MSATPGRPAVPATAASRWRPRRLRDWVLIAVLLISGALVVLASVAAIAGLVSPEGDGLLGLDRRCEDAPFACGIAAGVLISVVPIVIAVLTLLLWRLRRVGGLYLQRARDHAEDLVEVAHPPDHVVGRDGLCAVIQENLADREARRPHLLVGSVGDGKTAILLHLTRLLAANRNDAIPVPVRLRDAEKVLDFEELARTRFLREVERWLVSDAEGDKIWRKLREQDRIVVLADGLEEALSTDDAMRSRDTAIRLAFDAAREKQLPLVVTSRHHDAVRYADVAMLRLEPLSEAAALGYIRAAPDAEAKVRLIVERAEVVESPIFMELARELNDHGLLKGLDTRLTRRLALRVRLLDRWREALVGGQLLPLVPYGEDERKAALADLEALAAIGLAIDRLEVAFDAPKGSPRSLENLLGLCSDVRQAASVGSRLKVVEPQSAGVRFRHSIVQAYLGSRAIERLPDRTDYLTAALADPGREVMMALVMFCSRAGDADRRQVRDELFDRAKNRGDWKAFDLLAAGIEIDGMLAERHDDGLQARVEAVWRASRDAADDAAKLRAVRRLGDVARSEPSADAEVAAAQVPARDDRARDAVLALWKTCTEEGSYPVRVAAAQEMAGGGALSFGVLRTNFEETLEEARALYRDGATLTPELERRFGLQGWVLPTITGSLRPEDARDAMALMRAWCELLRRDDMHLSVEASWAQGFKYEANRRPSCADASMRVFLAEEGALFLERAKFWYSQVSLLQASTLWQLEDEENAEALGDDSPRRRRRRRQRRQAGEAARRMVRGWSRGSGHPFADEAAALCELAIDSGEPGRYLWIDEVGVTAKLGPRGATRAVLANRRLWISPAAGWLALDPRARALVAEIVVTLNLAERTDSTSAEQRLRRANNALPLCLTEAGGRDHLEVGGSHVVRGPRPGSTCAHGCRANLCPYPPPGRPPFRGELSEAFCRDQQASVGGRDGSAPWAARQSVRERREFWKKMEARARL